MNKTFNSSEMPSVTRNEIELAIRRARQLRSEMLMNLLRQFGGWLHRSLAVALAWRPSASSHILPLNR